MFPSFSTAQLGRLEQVGHRRNVEGGQVVIEQGGAAPDLFVVISGVLEIVGPADGKEVPIAVLRSGQFTGEVNMLARRRSLVRARMTEPGELLVITPEALRKIVQSDTELSDVLMRAFILRRIDMSDGGSVTARSVVIASGVQYRKLPLANLGRFEGLGVYYGVTQMEAQLCEGEDLVIVGGGNSAGQGAVFLAPKARSVRILVRGPGLAATMSRYLIQRIEDTPNITVHPFHQVVGLEGDARLERVQVRDAGADRTATLDAHHLFLMTGATPNTGWLKRCIALDEKGFVKTGHDLDHGDLGGWPLARAPFLLETSVPAVFAVGDVRAGSVKRVASAVGEGSICIQLVHRSLAG
jgi:thioredoxin reductase